MKKNRFTFKGVSRSEAQKTETGAFLFGVLAAALAFALVFGGCAKKDSGGGSGGDSGGGAAGAAAAVKNAKGAAPASDFSYDLSEDGAGIKITGYTGKGRALVIPAVIEDMPVVEIGEQAFQGAGGNKAPNNRDAITSVVVPDSVTTIGEFAFADIDELTEVRLPDSVTTIGDYAFADIDELTEVRLPDSLKVIPGGAFSNCGKLSKANLPASLEVIDVFAFSGCGELTELTIPADLQPVKFLDYYGHTDAFKGCGKLPIKTRQRIKELGYGGEF